MIFLTSDLHLCHERIMSFGRGNDFDSIVDMHSTIIKNWNSRVSQNDEVYFLGDMYLDGAEKTAQKYKNIYDNLNGKIHFVLGNHDKEDAIKEAGCFESVSHYKELKISKKKMIVMMHYPILSWNNKRFGSIMAHGHCHGNLDCSFYTNSKTIDVGIDTNNYYPYSVDEIIELTKNKKILTIDHH